MHLPAFLTRKNIILIVSSLAVVVVLLFLSQTVFQKKIKKPQQAPVAPITALTQAQVWNPTNGEVVRSLSELGGLIAAALEDNGIMLLSLSNFAEVSRLTNNSIYIEAQFTGTDSNAFLAGLVSLPSPRLDLFSVTATNLSNVTTMPLEGGTPVALGRLRPGLPLCVSTENGLIIIIDPDTAAGKLTERLRVQLPAGHAVHLYCDGKYLLASARDEGLYIIDLRSGRILSRVRTSVSSVQASFSQKNLLIIADKMQGLIVYDIGNPRKPSQIANYDTAGDASDLSLAGNHIFVSDGISGVMEMNWKKPADFLVIRDYEDTTILNKVLPLADGTGILAGRGKDGIILLR